MVLIKRVLQVVSIIALLLLLTEATIHQDVTLPIGVKADWIVVEKSKRRLSLYSNRRLLKEYHIALGKSPIGKKQREGDKKTPEGIYQIDFKKYDSAFHLALHISYPNREDRENAKKGGFAPGGAVMIHGLKNGLGWIGYRHRLKDWTNGCIAVTDWEIDEISRAVPNGTIIEIKP